MSRVSTLAAMRGEATGLVAGISWLPASALAALTEDTAVNGSAESLAVLVRALELDFAFVPAEQPWAAEAVERLHDAGAVAVWATAGVLGRLGDRMGWTAALRLTAGDPGTLAAPLAEVLHDVLGSVRAGVAAGADAVVLADDLAGAVGPLVSPDFALDALVPCYHSVAAEAGARGIPAVFHSDGDIRVLLPALARAGFSALHAGSLSGEAFAATLVSARAAGMTVLGGIEAAQLTSGARHSGVEVGTMALAGGLIMCDDGGLTTAVEVTAYATAIEAGREAFSLGTEHSA